jgi:hypothetical protein
MPSRVVERQRKFLDPEVIMDARVVFKNFAGREGQYNDEGSRNFGVLLDKERADRMSDLGWNVKQLQPKEEGEEVQPWIPVAIGYGRGRPPKVIMITSQGKTELSEDLIEALDIVEWANCDLILRPYSWGPIQGNYGVKAYLKSIAVTVLEDEIDRKYADVPMIGESRLAIDPGDTVNVIQGRVLDDDDVDF